MNYVVVGAFVLLLGVVLIGGVLWIASGGMFQEQFDSYLAIMDESVAGLNVNAPVKYSGVNVGKVSEIELDPTNSERVRLALAIERGTPITRETVAVLKIQGLTGIAYVDLSGSAAGAPPLRATRPGQYPEIRTKPSLSARLENVLSSVLAKLDSTSASINSILSEENRAAFASALADIADVARTISARREELDAAIASARTTLDNSARASTQLETVVAQIGRGAKSMERMGDEVARTSAVTGQTVNEVGADVKRFTSETLPELERLLGELNVLSISLRRLSEQTERNPSGLLFGRVGVPEGPGESTTGK